MLVLEDFAANAPVQSGRAEHSDTSAIVTQAVNAIVLTHRLYCKRHNPDVNALQADEIARSAFDSITRRERFSPAYASQVGLNSMITKTVDKLGLHGDPDLMSDLTVHLAGLTGELPHHLTVI